MASPFLQNLECVAVAAQRGYGEDRCHWSHKTQEGSPCLRPGTEMGQRWLLQEWRVAIKVIDKRRARKDTYVTKNLRREGQIQQMIRHPNITQLLDILETENSYYLVMELSAGGGGGARRARKDTYVTKNLRREGQIQQMIRHPNITQLLDILETENSYYLVMELCPGGNLMHRIYEKKRLEEAEARRYIRQLISAVEHLHRAGVVHRDLKIENLLLDEDNNIKLIDFGLSNCAGILGHSDPFSTQCGSPAYAAPELLARKKYGPKIDVWSIGVNMYAMLTGTLPFTVEPFSLRALYQKMVDKEMNPLPTQLSTGAVSFLRSLLEPDPVKRPNIQQALANRWLHESHTGRVPCVTYPNRISLADLSPSVVLHMTQKLGYKNSDVINTVLANRACHILAVYFLLNKKLERYVSGKSDLQDGVCSKAPLCPADRCRPGREPCEASLDTWTRDLEFHAGQDKTPREQEKKGDFLPRPCPQKLEKHLPAPRQPPASLGGLCRSVTVPYTDLDTYSAKMVGVCHVLVTTTKKS
ncbi:PREDICTED: hormonally up-regulated neu tumor-associated kinase [Myotis davidii]|uniref:hormonally up-regulated neu tumor-associated kinase n=1 Tax=Myotis davidii TaxID=225400 RepID=UPI000767972B|nr:PREDICTED: hormonally up-regulated neu tumor-associated kinase [Myotis davidii]